MTLSFQASVMLNLICHTITVRNAMTGGFRGRARSLVIIILGTLDVGGSYLCPGEQTVSKLSGLQGGLWMRKYNYDNDFFPANSWSKNKEAEEVLINVIYYHCQCNSRFEVHNGRRRKCYSCGTMMSENWKSKLKVIEIFAGRRVSEEIQVSKRRRKKVG
jgi:hypothetical protein